MSCEQLEQQLREQGLRVRTLERQYTNSAQVLRNAIRGNRQPILVNGLLDTWRASKTWSFEQLKMDHGEQKVQALMDLPSQGVFFPKEQKKYEHELKFSDFLDEALRRDEDSPCYLAYQRTEQLFSPQDYNFTSLLERLNKDGDSRVWIGSKGTRSMLHSDLKDNLFCQLSGEKKVILVSWEESVFVYPCLNNIVNSEIDLAEINLKRYPKLKKATFYSITMGPGDLLFIPRGWWHDIRSISASVSLNHWFGEALSVKAYCSLLYKLGPRCWWAVLKDFFSSGLLKKTERTHFFFSPPSTGKRLYDLIRWGNFSKENDPALDK